MVQWSCKIPEGGPDSRGGARCWYVLYQCLIGILFVVCETITHLQACGGIYCPPSNYKTIYLDLAPVGRLARHILPPLSPSQPVIAEKKISCLGKEPSRSSLPSFLSLVSFLLSSHSLIFTACSDTLILLFQQLLFCTFTFEVGQLLAVGRELPLTAANNLNLKFAGSAITI